MKFNGGLIHNVVDGSPANKIFRLRHEIEMAMRLDIFIHVVLLILMKHIVIYLSSRS